MANIRIKDLSTTAAVTASDDFIAVDGATNGTRKLDAYSPTFGGNLTVSGNVYGAPNLVLNGTTGATGNVYLRAQGIGYVRVDTGSGFRVESGSLDVTAGNLTVSGGTTTITGSAPALALKRSSDNSFVGYIDATTTGTLRLFSGVGGSNALAASFPQNGNLILKSDGIDSGNGKLQLATHTTSAGGIGFGTDTSLFRAASGNLGLYGTGTSSKITFSHSTTTAGKGFELECDTSKDGYIWNRENRNIFFGTNNTLALTLDSSQRCILAGALRLNNAYTASAVVPTGYVTIQDSTGTTYKVCVLL